MIILDTNVLSELMRDLPHPAVLSWLDHQPPSSVWLSTVTLMEIDFGLHRMPQGIRRDRMIRELENILHEEIEERFAPFDKAAARQAAYLVALQQTKGPPIEFRDAMIAGTVLSTNSVLATRNISHFTGLGIRLVNPWDQ
jgi:predicted nucleic acid-binding protein